MSKSSTVRRCWLWLADQGQEGSPFHGRAPDQVRGDAQLAYRLGLAGLGRGALLPCPDQGPQARNRAIKKPRIVAPDLIRGPPLAVRTSPSGLAGQARSLRPLAQSAQTTNRRAKPGDPRPWLDPPEACHTTDAAGLSGQSGLRSDCFRPTAPDFVVPLSPRRRVFPPGLGTRGASVRSGRPDRRSAPTDRGCGAWSGLRCRWRCRSGRWCRPSTSWRRARSSGPAC